MSSNEKLILLGKKIKFEELKEKIIIKLKNYSHSLEEHCSTILIDDLEKMDEKAIQVFSEELVKQIKELRKIGEKLKKINALVGDE